MNVLENDHLPIRLDELGHLSWKYFHVTCQFHVASMSHPINEYLLIADT